jgi:hypothetical protein
MGSLPTTRAPRITSARAIGRWLTTQMSYWPNVRDEQTALAGMLDPIVGQVHKLNSRENLLILDTWSSLCMPG